MINFNKGFSDGKPDCFCLTFDAPAFYVYLNVEFTGSLGYFKRLGNDILEGQGWEIYFVIFAVDDNSAVAIGYISPGNRGFPSSGSVCDAHSSLIFLWNFPLKL